MASHIKNPISEECRMAINHVASYELHISDAYLSMACCYFGDTDAPLFATFFEDQAEVKREHGKQFIRYLKKREGQLCFPVIKRPEMETWATGSKALECALDLENNLTKLLQDLRAMASDNSDKDLFRFLGKYLDKQKRNTDYLDRQIIYYKGLERQAQQEVI